MKYLVIAIAICLGIMGKAQKNSADKSESPYFLIMNDDDQKPLLPLQSTGAKVNIAGVIAEVKVNQTYENQGSVPIEAMYIFPASTRAAVYNMEMTIGDRTIEAVVKEKEEAKAAYDQAIDEGKTASLLEQKRPNVFQMRVGNIMPGDVINVELSYTELLIPENGIYEFVYPTVVGPRYSNGQESDKDNSWIGNPYTKENVKPSYTFNLQANLNAGVPLQSIRSTTHQVDIKYQGENTANVTLKSDEAKSGNKDFILQYQLAGNQIETGNLFYEGDGENFFLTMLQPPQRVNADTRTAREYIFVVDVSGSMAGFPLSISKKIMNSLLNSLSPGDKFNILTFAGASEELFPESVDATESNIAKAQQFMESRHGGGGTELLPAMNKALNYENRDDDYARTFVILTDGYVSVEKQTYDLIREKLNRANFFAFGIGSSVNRYLIEGIAHAGKGYPFVATNIKEADKQADKFIQYVSNPVLTNISMSFNGFDAYDVEPLNIPDLFAERPIIVFGKYNGSPAGTITINGTSASGKYNEVIRLNNEKANDNNSALQYLWAREKLQTLADFNQVENNKALKTEITDIGLKYNLLTDYTSFVAIDSEIRNTGDTIVKVRQPLPLPEGVPNTAVAETQFFRSYNSGAAQLKSTVRGVQTQVAEEDFMNHEYEYVELDQEETDPAPPNGLEQFKNYILEELQDELKNYPEYHNKTMRIYIKVDSQGHLSLIRTSFFVHQKLHNRLKEAIEKATTWKPATQNGNAIESVYQFSLTL